MILKGNQPDWLGSDLGGACRRAAKGRCGAQGTHRRELVQPLPPWSGGFAFSTQHAGEFIECHEADAVGRRQPRTILIIEH